MAAGVRPRSSAAAEKLPVRAERVVRLASIPKRMQLLRDLCVIARAEGKVGEIERRCLEQLASLLELPQFFVEQSLCTATELD